MKYHGIDVDSAKIAAFCRAHGIARLSFFGSILRDDFGPESDIDVLVDFLPGCTPSLLQLGGMMIELTNLFGRQVDLKTRGFISGRILDRVLAEAQVQYAERDANTT